MRVFLLFTILASVLGAVVPQLELEQRSYSMWSPDDVQQRDQANCWWLSVLMAVAEKNPAQYSIVMRQLEKPGSIMKGFFVNFPGSGTTSTKACPMWVIEGKAVNTPSVSSSAAKWWPDALTYAAQHGYGTTNRFDWPINAFRLLYGKQPSNVESATEVLTDEEWPAALKLLKTANKNPTTAGFQRFKGPKLYASNEKSIPLSTVHAYAVDRISGKK
jgi:hypothetical protein